MGIPFTYKCLKCETSFPLEISTSDVVYNCPKCGFSFQFDEKGINDVKKGLNDLQRTFNNISKRFGK